MVIKQRIGLVIPSLNVIVEDDMRRESPTDVGVHFARLRLRKTQGKVTQAALLEAGTEAVQQATLLADAGLDAIAFNCTGASLSDGPDGARRLCHDIEAAAATRATTTILAVVNALRASGLRRIVHICPFTAEFSTDEANFLRAEGFDVVASRGLNFTDARVAAKLTPAEICEVAAGLDQDGADGMFLACANVRAMEATAALRARLGKPVITSNQAILWELLRLLEHPAASTLLSPA